MPFYCQCLSTCLVCLLGNLASPALSPVPEPDRGLGHWVTLPRDSPLPPYPPGRGKPGPISRCWGGDVRKAQKVPLPPGPRVHPLLPTRAARASPGPWPALQLAKDGWAVLVPRPAALHATPVRQVSQPQATCPPCWGGSQQVPGLLLQTGSSRSCL